MFFIGFMECPSAFKTPAAPGRMSNQSWYSHVFSIAVQRQAKVKSKYSQSMESEKKPLFCLTCNLWVFVMVIKQKNMWRRGYVIREGGAASIINLCLIQSIILTNDTFFTSVYSKMKYHWSFGFIIAAPSKNVAFVSPCDLAPHHVLGLHKVNTVVH